MNVVHELKTVNPYFEDVWNGMKNFEMRKNDRHFHVGDIIYLKEYDTGSQLYLGRVIRAEIEYILKDFGELKQYVVFSFKITQRLSS